MSVNRARIRCLKEGLPQRGPVAYWMSRDQRMHDNWALLYAQEIALKRKASLLIVFCLVPEFLNATFRQYEFMLGGLEEVITTACLYNIPFYLCLGKPEEEIPRFVTSHRCGVLITDFDPLRIKRRWKDVVAHSITIPFYEVDAHNIVPCWKSSGKQEYSAFTIRKKIFTHLPEFLDVFPELEYHPYRYDKPFVPPDLNAARQYVPVNSGIPSVGWLKPGEKHAHEVMDFFIKTCLSRYAQLSNDPNASVLSNLSPYIHFGQISAQRVALEVSRQSASTGTNSEAFLEQLIVRRELADNYCNYCKEYDSFKGLPQWAQRTLNDHRDDQREYSYTMEEFETAQTHDMLWNAAQLEMVYRGKMHSYIRMYWAKKILEWSPNPETALEIAIYLNDRYELDGRDPNGYTGIMWSIGGLHDRAWSERPIFGKIRYMTYNGCKKKFNIQAYIDRIDQMKQQYS